MPNQQPADLTFLGRTREKFDGKTVVCLTLYHNLCGQVIDFDNDDAACPQPGCSTRDYVCEDEKFFGFPGSNVHSRISRGGENLSCAPEVEDSLNEHTESIVIRNGRLQSCETYYNGYNPIYPPIICLSPDGETWSELRLVCEGIEFARKVLVGDEVLSPLTDDELAYVRAQQEKSR